MNLEMILTKAENETLDQEEIQFLLEQEQASDVEKIYTLARKIREKQFGSQVFLYGFVYFSTYCRNNCTFCYFRKDNRQPVRYRKTEEEILKTAVELKESGVHLMDLTMGEDPYYQEDPQRLASLIQKVKKATGLPVMISSGVVSDEVLDLFHEAGADWYALYQETHTKKLYEKLRLKQDYQERMHAKEYAGGIGMLVEEGLLTGIGDESQDALHSFREMKRIGASQVRVMTFIPQKGTPLEKQKANTFQRELLYIAIMRILFPHCLIPASLDVEGLSGLESRLNAGANVVTSIIPPREGYMGVANAETDVDQGYRTVAGIQDTLKRCGLRSASAASYGDWIQERFR